MNPHRYAGQGWPNCRRQVSRKVVRVSACLLAVVGFPLNSFAQDPAVGDLPPNIDAIEQRAFEEKQAVEEINAIRARLGGGVTETLSELFADSPANSALPPEELQQAFQRELQSLVAADVKQPVAGPTEPSPNTPSIAVGKPNTGETEAAEISSRLRFVAKQMEQSAYEFETVGLYRDADQLREMAKHYWHRARYLDQDSR